MVNFVRTREMPYTSMDTSDPHSSSPGASASKESEELLDWMCDEKKPYYMHPAHDDKCVRYSQMSIDFFNSVKGTAFKLVEALVLVSLPGSPIKFAHLNFIARDTSPNCSDTSLKLFFAEVDFVQCRFGCTMLDLGNPNITIGCGGCNPRGIVYHPPGPLTVFSGGNYMNLKYKRDGKSCPYEEHVKKHFWESYTPVVTIEVADSDAARDFKDLCCYIAETSLEGYLTGDLELVQITSAVRFVGRYNYRWIHVNFIAKRKNYTDCLPQCIFVEFLEPGIFTKIELVSDVNSDEPDSNIAIGCGVCPSFGSVYHPVGEYDGGSNGTILQVLEEEWSCLRKYELIPVSECPRKHIRNRHVRGFSRLERMWIRELRQGKASAGVVVGVGQALRDALREVIRKNSVVAYTGRCFKGSVDDTGFYIGSTVKHFCPPRPVSPRYERPTYAPL